MRLILPVIFLIQASFALASSDPKPDAKADSKAEPAANEEKSATSKSKRDSRTANPTKNYINKWLKLPEIEGVEIFSDKNMKFEQSPGKMAVVFFLASWCEQCQKLMQEFRNVEARFNSVHTEFIYVFCHDTKDDARGFAREFGLTKAILANHDILKNYHNPELPSVYFSDRRGWLTKRYLKTTKNDMESLATLINQFTAL